MALIVSFRNISGLSAVSNYEWTTYLNERVIDRGTVRGHRRADGWPALVQRMLTQYHEQQALEQGKDVILNDDLPPKDVSRSSA